MKLIQDYLADADKYPLFLNGDSLEILKSFPDESIDCCITSPPYWGKRQYENAWRVALKMMDDGWILRNDVIWYMHAGISTLLGLNSKANIQFEKIAKILESKISDSTVFNIGE